MPPVYDADADAFLEWSPLLWEPLGARLVDIAAPQPGQRVFDACSGAGASALQAAGRVGPLGHVDAVDLTEQLVRQLRLAAALAGLEQVHAQLADVTTWTSGTGYDVVLCGYGAFFLPDLEQGGRHLVSQLRPGGRLAASTWDRNAMAFVGTVYEAVRSVRPEVTPPVRSDRWLDTPALLADWLERVGLSQVEVHPVSHRVELSPETAWSFVTGTGLRSLLAPLPESAVTVVRQRLTELLDAGHGWELVADSLIGIGQVSPELAAGREEESEDQRVP